MNLQDGSGVEVDPNQTMISTPAYIAKVYATLSLGIVCTALGTYFTGVPLYFPLVITIPFMIDTAWNECQTQQVISFLIVSFCQGLVLADIVNLVDKEILLTAFSTTLMIFLSISLAAYFSKDTSTLASYSILGCSASLLLCLSLVNMYMQSEALLFVDVILGILTFSGYIFCDTIKMIMIYEQTDVECIGTDALGMYLDLINLFIRILVLLGKIKEKENDTKKKKD